MERKFAEGFCFKKLFLFFVLGSIAGTYYEQILGLVKQFCIDGSIFWEYRHGVIYGPFNPLYGLGAVIPVILLERKKLSNLKVFLYGTLIGGFLEYIINFFQELFVGTSSWNYNGYFLNINGRTTIPFMIIWGLIILIVVKYIYPIFSKIIEKIPYKIGNICFYFLFIFLILDMLISFTALFRQNLRRNNIPAYTIIGELCDKYYSDEVLHHYYPNMEASK